MDHHPASRNLTRSDVTETNRRRLLGWLAIGPLMCGLAILTEHGAVEAKKKRKKRRKRRNSTVGAGSGGSGGSVPYVPDSEEQAFLGLINAYRGQKGVAPLSLQSQLGAAAEQHAQSMASKSAMVHVPNLQAYLLSFGYPAVSWAENIAAGYGTAQQVFDAWKKSPTHNTNMLSGSFTEIGIGRAYNPGSTHGWYWCTEFGRR